MWPSALTTGSAPDPERPSSSPSPGARARNCPARGSSNRRGGASPVPPTSLICAPRYWGPLLRLAGRVSSSQSYQAQRRKIAFEMHHVPNSPRIVLAPAEGIGFRCCACVTGGAPALRQALALRQSCAEAIPDEADGRLAGVLRGEAPVRRSAKRFRMSVEVLVDEIKQAITLLRRHL